MLADKAQDVRLIDVFLLGPFLVWYAVQSESTPGWARAVLGLAGVLTVIYNGSNYLNREAA